MIVRIMGEGQYDVDSSVADDLNRIDAQLEKAVNSGEEAAFRAALTALLEKIRTSGHCLPDDALEPSDAVLPPADAALEEVRALLADSDEGLIPG